MMKRIFTISVLLLLVFGLHAQDKIVKLNGEEITAAVKEISDTEIKYKKFSNPDGPMYIVKVRDVAYIQYKNGDKEIYNEVASEVESHRVYGIQFDKELFDRLAARGNKVYFKSNNSNAIIHARNKLMQYGFWEETKSPDEADFILYFQLDLIWPTYNAFAKFIDPETKEVFYLTYTVNSVESPDVNTKRGAINSLIDREILPLMLD